LGQVRIASATTARCDSPGVSCKTSSVSSSWSWKTSGAAAMHRPLLSHRSQSTTIRTTDHPSLQPAIFGRSITLLALQAAGVTKGTFYFHFAHKEEILLELGYQTGAAFL
jgi:Bacterial regulatory proteins, tetR family